MMYLNNKYVNNMFIKKSASVLAFIVLIVVKITINSTCMVPFYEPEQPEELERLKFKR